MTTSNGRVRAVASTVPSDARLMTPDASVLSDVLD